MSLINKYRILFTIRKLLTVAIIFASVNELFSQGSTIHIEIKDGKYSFKQETPGMPLHIFKYSRNILNNSLQNSPGSGTQKNFTVAAPITVNVTTTGSTCHFPNGSVIALASGGTPPYTYNLTNFGTQNNGNYPQVPGGNYTLTVTDAAAQTTSI